MSAIDEEGAMPLWRQVYWLLRARIESGEVQPGRALPSKARICQETGVTGNTVEHAIRQLKADGLVTGVQGRGVFANPRSEWMS